MCFMMSFMLCFMIYDPPYKAVYDDMMCDIMFYVICDAFWYLWCYFMICDVIYDVCFQASCASGGKWAGRALSVVESRGILRLWTRCGAENQWIIWYYRPIPRFLGVFYDIFMWYMIFYVFCVVYDMFYDTFLWCICGFSDVFCVLWSVFLIYDVIMIDFSCLWCVSWYMICFLMCFNMFYDNSWRVLWFMMCFMIHFMFFMMFSIVYFVLCDVFLWCFMILRDDVLYVFMMLYDVFYDVWCVLARITRSTHLCWENQFPRRYHYIITKIAPKTIITSRGIHIWYHTTIRGLCEGILCLKMILFCVLWSSCVFYDVFYVFL